MPKHLHCTVVAVELALFTVVWEPPGAAVTEPVALGEELRRGGALATRPGVLHCGGKHGSTDQRTSLPEGNLGYVQTAEARFKPSNGQSTAKRKGHRLQGVFRPKLKHPPLPGAFQHPGGHHRADLWAEWAGGGFTRLYRFVRCIAGTLPGWMWTSDKAAGTARDGRARDVQIAATLPISPAPPAGPRLKPVPVPA